MYMPSGMKYNVMHMRTYMHAHTHTHMHVLAHTHTHTHTNTPTSAPPPPPHPHTHTRAHTHTFCIYTLFPHLYQELCGLCSLQWLFCPPVEVCICVCTCLHAFSVHWPFLHLRCFCILVLLMLAALCAVLCWLSPWYNRAGWLGVKHQFTYLCWLCQNWNQDLTIEIKKLKKLRPVFLFFFHFCLQKFQHSLKSVMEWASPSSANRSTLVSETPSAMPTFVDIGNKGDWSDPPRDCTKLWGRPVHQLMCVDLFVIIAWQTRRQSVLKSGVGHRYSVGIWCWTRVQKVLGWDDRRRYNLELNMGTNGIGMGCRAQVALGLGVGLWYKQCWDWVLGSGTNSIEIGCQTWVQTVLGLGARLGYSVGTGCQTWVQS